MKRRTNLSYLLVSIGLFFIMLIFSVIVVLFPVMVTTSRALIALTILFGIHALLILLFHLTSRRRLLKYTLIVGLIIIAAWFVFGGRQVDKDGLREAYIAQMKAFSGSKYSWGGETSRGIDCSGLARTALWQTMLKEGVKHANPRLLGPDLWQFWWRDLSASAMGKEEYGYTRVIGHTEKLAGCDTSALKKGDLAVIGSTHVLIYCGDNRWIEASPEDHRVVINTAYSDSKRAWFNAGPVIFVRWWILDDN